MRIDEQGENQLRPIPGNGAHNAMWMPLLYPERVRLFRETLITEASAQTLYHYTNVSAFYSIVSNCGLWASHIAYMNDASEIHHGRQFAQEILRRLARKDRYQFFRHILIQIIDTLENNVLPEKTMYCQTCTFAAFQSGATTCRNGALTRIERAFALAYRALRQNSTSEL